MSARVCSFQQKDILMPTAVISKKSAVSTVRHARASHRPFSCLKIGVVFSAALLCAGIETAFAQNTDRIVAEPPVAKIERTAPRGSTVAPADTAEAVRVPTPTAGE